MRVGGAAQRVERSDDVTTCGGVVANALRHVTIDVVVHDDVAIAVDNHTVDRGTDDPASGDLIPRSGDKEAVVRVRVCHNVSNRDVVSAEHQAVVVVTEIRILNAPSEVDTGLNIDSSPAVVVGINPGNDIPCVDEQAGYRNGTHGAGR